MPHSSKLFNGFYFLDPIDCVEDPCHLAWLVRDNPILLNAVPDAQCANGTSLKSLNPATLCYVNKIICSLNNRHQSKNAICIFCRNWKRSCAQQQVAYSPILPAAQAITSVPTTLLTNSYASLINYNILLPDTNLWLCNTCRIAPTVWSSIPPLVDATLPPMYPAAALSRLQRK